jgi:NADH dehydrogenase
MENSVTNILIIGGGFAGVRTALGLACSSEAKSMKIRILSDKPHFEYQPAMYRLATGSSPHEVCIPLNEIFSGKDVDMVLDTAVSLDQEKKMVVGASGTEYHYDKLVLALGAETNYFGIPGLKEHTYGLKSIKQALELRKGIDDTLKQCKSETERSEMVCDAHFIVIGGGATGVELAGELVPYAKERAKAFEVDPNLVTVDLIEAAPRLLPLMPEWLSYRVEKHLRHIGVNIYTNRAVQKQEIEETILKDMRMRAKTVVWTSGVKANDLYGKFALPLDPRGRVTVDDQLHPVSAEGAKTPDIFVGGDGAATKSTGFAQTAYHDGEYIARVIVAELRGGAVPAYKPITLSYAMPAGRKWAAVLISNVGIFGRMGWWIRRVADLRALATILPWGKAFTAWRHGEKLRDDCVSCIRYLKDIDDSTEKEEAGK